MSEPTIEDFISQLKSPQANIRRNAAWVLGRFRDLRAVQPLVDALQDADVTVRARAAEALGARREETVVAPLLACLTDTDPDVRRMAARSLGYIAHPDAVAPLIACLYDADETVRAHSAEAFGTMAQATHTDIPDLTPAIPHLVTALIDDEDANVRYSATQSLQTIHTPTVYQVLMDVTQQQTDPAILIDLITLMGKLADPYFKPMLDDYTHHKDADVIMVARWALSALES